jgi:subfamily B ATP-binding cassette protein HlyB/CyaB
MMASLHGVAADAAQLRHEHGGQVFSAQSVLLAAKQLGLSAKLVQQSPERLALASLAAVKPHDSHQSNQSGAA